MTIKGTVEDIIFRNEENGYTVMNVDADGDLIVAVGIFPIINQGETLKLNGEMKFNAKFGEQFMVESFEFIKPDDAEGIKRYLASGLFTGVGKATAEAIVNYFGDKTLEIIEKTPQKLMKVPGIGAKKAADIERCYMESSKVRDALIFLQKYGITTQIALKIYKEYEEDTVYIVKSNPYKLVEDIEGIGFLTADKIAERMGIEKDSDFRLKAALLHALKEASQKNGHTCLPKNILIKDTMALTSVFDKERIERIIDNEYYSIKKTEYQGEEYISLSYIYNTENAIAAKLVMLNNMRSDLDIDCLTELQNYQKTNNIILDQNQKEAVKKSLDEGVVIITGGPGTGKTTIIKCLTTILKQRGKKVALAAPTGRAAKRMTQATGEEAKTIHRLLGITGKNFDFSQINILDYDVVIVDEISMADIFIFNYLLKAMPGGARLILVGDKDQLPSVACGNILSDMISSGMFCTVYLNEIYRQAKKSMIVVNAHRINNCQYPVTENCKDFFIDNKSSPEDIKRSVITMASSRIPGYLNITPKEIQVLAPIKKGAAGVEALNKELQKALNPQGKQIIYKNKLFRVGDKVMHTVNNYALEWIKSDFTKESGTGVFNGDIGYIVDIRDNEIIVEFEDNKIVRYKDDEIEELMTAYCISVHKSQGSEFPVVIMAITSGSYAILTKNLLYTAVTRAKEMVVLVGDEKNIKKMVKNTFTSKRFSLLPHLLESNSHKFQILKGIN